MLNRSALAVLAAAFLALPAVSKDHSVVGTGKVEILHAQCIGYHGIPGYKTAFPDVYHVPKIAGQQPAYIVNALKAYKTGERSHPSMRGIAASLTDEDMKKLADYYGGPAKAPEAGKK